MPARGCRVRHDLASEQQTNTPLLATRKDAGFFFLLFSKGFNYELFKGQTRIVWGCMCPCE